MALRQQQELKQTQKLSPLQMQVIKLVELNSVELEDKIKQELEDNPALEEGSEQLGQEEGENFAESEEQLSEEDILMGDYFSEEDIPDYQLNKTQKKRSRLYRGHLFQRQESQRGIAGADRAAPPE